MSYSPHHTNTSLGLFSSISDSIRRIITTPIGSRVSPSRAFGSNIFQLVDGPMNPGGVMRMRIATIDALEKWEPRIILKSSNVSFDSSGTVLVAAHYYIKGSRELLATSVGLGMRRAG